MDETDSHSTADAQRVQIAARRYREETRGLIVDGYGYATDRESQAMIAHALAAMDDNPDMVVRWKTAQGFIDMDQARLTAVRDAVRDHVQACFDREDALLAKLGAGTYRDEMLGTGWPG